MQIPVKKFSNPDTVEIINFYGALHTNPSLIRQKDYWIMLMREKMGISNLLIARLNDSLEIESIKPFITKKHYEQYKWGAEDPRLFWHNDELKFIFHGSNENGVRTIIGNIETDKLENLSPQNIQEIFYTPGSEKNWTFFSYKGDQYAINSYCPTFKIVKIENGVALDYYVDKMAFNWNYGEPHGGTPAIRIGEDFYTVFQSNISSNGMPRYYSAAFAKFSAKPPFKVKAITQPILIPDEYRDWGYSVVFPAGLQLYKGKWFISYGHMDSECRICTYDFARIESMFVEV